MEYEELLKKWFSEVFNRHPRQVDFLYELLDCDFNLLLRLELALKNNFVFKCPNSKEECLEIIGLGLGSNWFTLPTVQTSDYFYNPPKGYAGPKKT
jgi:hypothetical protein